MVVVIARVQRVPVDANLASLISLDHTAARLGSAAVHIEPLLKG